LLELENAKLGEDGTIEGLADQLKALAESEEASFMFNPAVPDIKGFAPYTGTAGTTVDFSKMSYSELCDFQLKNPGVAIS